MHSTIDAKRLDNKVTMLWNLRISTSAQSCTEICTIVQIIEGTSVPSERSLSAPGYLQPYSLQPDTEVTELSEAAKQSNGGKPVSSTASSDDGDMGANACWSSRLLLVKRGGKVPPLPKGMKEKNLSVV